MKYFLILCISISFAAFAEIINNEETGVVPTEKTDEFNSDLEQQRMEDRRIDDLRSDEIGDDLYQEEELESDRIQKEEESETFIP